MLYVFQIERRICCPIYWGVCARGEGNVARSFALRCSDKQTLRITLHSPSADAHRRVGRLTCDEEQQDEAKAQVASRHDPDVDDKGGQKAKITALVYRLGERSRIWT